MKNTMKRLSSSTEKKKIGISCRLSNVYDVIPMLYYAKFAHDYFCTRRKSLMHTKQNKNKYHAHDCVMCDV